MGGVASGKTTLSKKLANKYHIDFFSLDEIVHKSDGSYYSEDEQIDTVQKISKLDHYIIEGTYRKISDTIITNTTHIIWLDPPLYIKYYRIIKRYFKQCLHIEQSHYKPTLKMLCNMFKWTKQFENQKLNISVNLNLINIFI